ncbi:MAG: hypothetical protein COA99_03060 [Moraxellaceae bacterium]|nr:MAG: hypothetical protein COA99_03060 [Moraxellaceae bacterium]
MASQHQKNQRAKSKKPRRDPNTPYPYSRKELKEPEKKAKNLIGPLLQQAEFVVSAQDITQCPPDEGFEVAFAGRSNSGKSSSINSITNQRKLARTSKTPGRTQLINFFAINDELRLVDLPGYGYAQVPESMKREWQANMSEYVERRECLAGLVLVMDIRHPLREFDLMMLDWSSHFGMPVHILLSKADKLNAGPAQSVLISVQNEVESIGDHISVQLFSSLKKDGVEQAQKVIARWFQVDAEINIEDS